MQDNQTKNLAVTPISTEKEGTWNASGDYIKAVNSSDVNAQGRAFLEHLATYRDNINVEKILKMLAQEIKKNPSYSFEDFINQLISSKTITDKDFLKTIVDLIKDGIEEDLGITVSYRDLSGFKVDMNYLSEQLREINGDISTLEMYQFYPYTRISPTAIELCCADIANEGLNNLIKEYEQKGYTDIVLSFITAGDFENILSQIQNPDEGYLQEAMQEFGKVAQQISSNDALDIDDSLVGKAFWSIVSQAIDMGSSDIHLYPEGDQMVYMRRIDSVLREAGRYPLTLMKYIVTKVMVETKAKIEAVRDAYSTQLAYNQLIGVKRYKAVLRVEFTPTYHPYVENACAITIRIALSKDRQQRAGLSSLGFSNHNIFLLRKLMNKKSGGVVLVCGPTGSGKTQTLYTVLEDIIASNKGKNIKTIEDPVERVLLGAVQSQVNEDVGYTFAKALRSFLRSDPDVIFVGEVRDEETATIAIRAALTGHLVFSTIHTNDAFRTVSRLTNMGVQQDMLADTLRGVVSQRLVVKLCPKCRIKIDHEDFNFRLNRLNIDTYLKKKFLLNPGEFSYVANSKGCKHCEGGYKGRIAIAELLYCTKFIQEQIEGSASATVIMKNVLARQIEIEEKIEKIQKEKQAETQETFSFDHIAQEFLPNEDKNIYENRYISIIEDGLYKVRDGIIDLEEIINLSEG